MLTFKRKRQLEVRAEDLWDSLFNTEFLKQCIKGCTDFQKHKANTFVLKGNSSLGPIGFDYLARLEVIDVIDYRSYTIIGSARADGLGHFWGVTTIELVPLTSPNATLFDCQIDLSLDNKIPALQSRFVAPLLDRQVNNVFTTFIEALTLSSAQAQQ